MDLPAFETINLRGRLLDLRKPALMGILNVTPDSFSDGGKYNHTDTALARTETLLSEGAALIDIGGYSSRPGAADISEEEELHRVLPVTEAILNRFPEALLSADTFRAEVARRMLDTGVHLINDITAGTGDPQMFTVAAQAGAPVILMHMQGNPQTMQVKPTYDNVVNEVYAFLAERTGAARQAGIRDIIVDPGFGFGKTVQHNYALFRNLSYFRRLGCPVVVGISRKSMLWKPLGLTPADVDGPAMALHLQALLAGARLLRVHEVAQAAQAVRLFELLNDGAF